MNKEAFKKVVVRIKDSKGNVIKRKKDFTDYDELMSYIDSNLNFIKENDYLIEIRDYIKNSFYAYGQIFYADDELCNYDHAQKFYKVFLNQDPNLTYGDLRLAGGIDVRLFNRGY